MTDLVTLVEGARARMEAGQPYHAELYYRQILELTDPPKTHIDRVARGEASTFFARRALHGNRVGEAGDWYKLALNADPRASDIRAEFVQKVLLKIGLVESALTEAKRATEIDPESIKAWTALGDAEAESENATAARAAYHQAWALAPSDPFHILKLAALELDAPDYPESARLAEIILTEFPERQGDALQIKAMVAYREGRHEAAIALFAAALEAGCSAPAELRFNRALPYHSIGRYREGWADWEARGQTGKVYATPFTRFALPMWDHQPPPARLHLHYEMGFGDSIAMIRYAPLLRDQGYDLQMEVLPEMVGLCQRSFPGITVCPRALDFPGTIGLSQFDYHIPMLSLPHLFGTTIETIPWSGPYLRPDPELVAEWQEKLPADGGPPRIGICWSSGIRDGLWMRQYGTRKSVKFETLKPLFEVEARWLSLQLGPPAAENDSIPTVLEAGDSWEKTSAIIANLDLVITVDTALSHLAGAIGKPCWIIMHTEGSWHYMADIEGAPWQHKSPWYPNTKLYRQQRPHEWDEVIARIAADLRQLA